MSFRIFALFFLFIATSANAMFDKEGLSASSSSAQSSSATSSQPLREAWTWEKIKNCSADEVCEQRIALRKNPEGALFQPSAAPEELACVHATMTELKDYVPFVGGDFLIQNLTITTHANLIADFFETLQALSKLPGVSSQTLQTILNDTSLEANHTVYINLSRVLNFLSRQSRAIEALFPPDGRSKNPIAIANNNAIRALNGAADRVYKTSVDYFGLLREWLSKTPTGELPTLKTWLSQQNLKLDPVMTVEKIQQLMQHPALDAHTPYISL